MKRLFTVFVLILLSSTISAFYQNIAASRLLQKPTNQHRVSSTKLFAKRIKKNKQADVSTSSSSNDQLLLLSEVPLAADSVLDSDGNSQLSDVVELDDEVKAKLKAEIASPFFRLRQFAYVALALAGSIGALTAVPQLVLALSSGEDVSTTAVNAAVDIGSVGAGFWLWNIDATRQSGKLSVFSEKQKQQSNRISTQETSERQALLKLLPIEISASLSNENMTRIVSFAELQEKGKQNIVIFAGQRAIVRDAILSAKIQGVDIFNSRETILVPVVMQEKEQFDDNSKGFASKEGLLASPFFGRPTQINLWQEFLQDEATAAERQGEIDILEKGLVLFVKSNGKIIRRGFGIPPWKIALDEFTKTTK